MDRITTSRPGLRSQIWQFARHFLEMCVAMCVGGGILNGLVFVAGPALLGYPDLRQQSPELALLVTAFDVTLPMALWMRFRGMAWRPTLEMSGQPSGWRSCCSGWIGSTLSTRARSAGWCLASVAQPVWSCWSSCCSAWSCIPDEPATTCDM
jgi:hypothetical protein